MTQQRTQNIFVSGIFSGILIFTSLLGSPAKSYALDCLDGDTKLAINNEVALQWKSASEDLFEHRAYLQGPIVRVDMDRNSHDHFAIQIGPSFTDTIEVVFNQSFGELPPLKLGDVVSACGDYITTIKAGKYFPSVDGAIIHWVHQSKSSHASGFVTINDIEYGHSNVPSKPAPKLDISEVKKVAVPPCFAVDEKEIILNPNYQVKGKPYRSVYGFVYDGTYIYNVYGADKPEVTRASKMPSFQRFVFETLENQSYGGECLSKGELGTKLKLNDEVPGEKPLPAPPTPL